MLEQALVFLLTSKTGDAGDTEGTPASLFSKAATVGPPIVSTIHAGIPELLPPDPARSVMLRPEGDVEGFAAALRALAADPGLRGVGSLPDLRAVDTRPARTWPRSWPHSSATRIVQPPLRLPPTARHNQYRASASTTSRQSHSGPPQQRALAVAMAARPRYSPQPK